MKLDKQTYYMMYPRTMVVRFCNGTDMNQIRTFVAPVDQEKIREYCGGVSPIDASWTCEDCTRKHDCNCKDNKTRFLAFADRALSGLREITEKEATTKRI